MELYKTSHLFSDQSRFTLKNDEGRGKKFIRIFLDSLMKRFEELIHELFLSKDFKLEQNIKKLRSFLLTVLVIVVRIDLYLQSLIRFMMAPTALKFLQSFVILFEENVFSKLILFFSLFVPGEFLQTFYRHLKNRAE